MNLQILWLDLTTGQIFKSGFLEGMFCALQPIQDKEGRGWERFEILEVGGVKAEEILKR